MVAGISLATRRRARSKPTDAGTAVAATSAPRTPSGRPPIVPLFIVGFMALVLVRSFVPVPGIVLSAADLLQTVFIAMALFAIGASLRVERLVRSGIRTLAAGAISWALILALGLGFVAVAAAS